MKKYLVFMSLLLAVGLVACGTNAAPPPSSSSTSAASGQNTGDALDPPADTALYRGQVEAIEAKNDVTEVVLAQVAGTNFGKSTQKVALTADTRTNFPVEGLNAGDYLEVYYGASVSGQVPDVVDAIVANLLPPAASSVLNGTVKEIKAEDDVNGRLLLAGLENGEDTWVLYNEETKLYLYIDSLQVGDTLSVLTNGTAALSYPPQVHAQEIRFYSEP